MLEVLSDIDSCGDDISDFEWDGDESSASEDEEEIIIDDNVIEEGSGECSSSGNDGITPCNSSSGPRLPAQNYKWKEVQSIGARPTLHYVESPGPCLPAGETIQEPEDYFSLFFGTDIFELMAEETNIYAQLLRDHRPMAPRSRLQNWRDASVSELKAFIGLVLNMGIIHVYPLCRTIGLQTLLQTYPFFLR